MNAIISKYIFEQSSPVIDDDSISYSVHAEGVFVWGRRRWSFRIMPQRTNRLHAKQQALRFQYSFTWSKYSQSLIKHKTSIRYGIQLAP
jgi:hypothetical protein